MADIVWSALGDVRAYIEPFFGSGAVLLARPDYDAARHMETVCDADGFVANVWRALQHDPDVVARWCDWPVNHADLSARKLRLIANKDRLLEHLVADDEWYDAKIAGYWVWAASCWIGAGLTRIGQIPHISDPGVGVHAIGQRPDISDSGNGVHAIGKRPHIGHAGKGIHGVRQASQNSEDDADVRDPYNERLYHWFRDLSARLRRVRVVCGDWTRVCGGDWQDNAGDVGIFFDPPYGDVGRDTDIYEQESLTVASDVRAWCLERGSRPTHCIVLAGYHDEHAMLLDHGWTEHRWRAQGGYANLGDGDSKENRHREALFFSPHCAGGMRQTVLDLCDERS